MTTEHELITLEAGVQRDVTDLLDVVERIEIQNDHDADCAATLRNQIVNKRKAIEAWFAEPIAAAHAAHKALTNRRADTIAKFTPAENAINQKIIVWHNDQERQRREAEEAAERERQRQIEEDRLRRAEEAESAGDNELAERIIEGRTPEPVPHVSVAAPIPHKPAGVSISQKPKGEVVDLVAVVKAAANGDRNALGILTVDAVKLNRLVSALGAALVIPGVRVSMTSCVRKSGRS